MTGTNKYVINGRITDATKYKLVIAFGDSLEWTGDKFCRKAIPAYLRIKGRRTTFDSLRITLESLLNKFHTEIDYSKSDGDVFEFVIRSVLQNLDQATLQEQLEATRLSLASLPDSLLPDALLSWGQLERSINS